MEGREGWCLSLNSVEGALVVVEGKGRVGTSSSNVEVSWKDGKLGSMLFLEGSRSFQVCSPKWGWSTLVSLYKGTILPPIFISPVMGGASPTPERDLDQVVKQVTNYAYQCLGGDLKATSKVMNRSVRQVRAWVRHESTPPHSKQKRWSLAYAKGYETWLVDLTTYCAEEGRAMGMKQLQLEWERRFGKAIPMRTLKRVCQDLKVVHKHQKVERKLTPLHHAKRVAFAQKHKSFQFHKVMFTDAHTLYLYPIGHGKGKKTMAPKGVTPKVFSHKTSPCIKVYGGVTIHGCTPLLEVTGTTDMVSSFVDGTTKSKRGGVTAMEYAYDVLPFFFKEGKRLFQGKTWTFQQDGDGAHTSKLTLKQLDDLGSEYNAHVMRDWPPMSPDLSPIENLWALLDMKVKACHPDTLDDLRAHMTKAWREISEGEVVRHLFQSMLRRMSLVLEKGGGRIDY